MASERKRIGWRWGVAAMVGLPLMYVTSYAPVVRWRSPAPSVVLGKKSSNASQPAFYRPVEWLIDNTPASGPLMLWARVWGVEDEIRVTSSMRRLFR